MNCKDAKIPINIVNSKSPCNNNCKFSFDYGVSSCLVKNSGQYLTLEYDGKNQITYNNVPLRIQEIRLYQPSIHLFNGNNVDAELLIHHIGNNGENIMVCIPIIQQEIKSNSNQFFSQFLPFVSSEEGEVSNINTKEWTLNNVVPKAPYNIYEGDLVYEPCSPNYLYVVFDVDYASTINNKNLQTLKSLIGAVPTTYKEVNNDVELFYNEVGSRESYQTTSEGDQIYIDCQPVDDDEKDDEEKQMSIQDIGTNLMNNLGISSKTKKKTEDEAKTDWKKYGEIIGISVGIIVMIFVLRYLKNRIL